MTPDMYKSVRELFKGDKVIIDNHVSRLHYKVTAFLLMAFSLLLSSRQYFGDPIDCIVTPPSQVIDSGALDTYCWIFSTFTVIKHLDGKVGSEVAFPGVGSLGSAGPQADEEVIRHKYYQWVGLMLCLQAFLFYVPHRLWLMMEGGRLALIANDLNCPLVNEIWSKNRLKAIADYLTVWKLNKQKSYAVKFALCELLNFLNVIGQMCILDRFFGGQFFSYGHDMFFTLFSGDDDADDVVMARVFPKVTKCALNYYGPSGTIQNVDAFCVLPLNIFNEKLFGFMYFWFLLLAFISFVAILYRLSFLGERVRLRVLSNRFEKKMSRKKVDIIMSKFDFGDCFFLCQLSKNMNPFLFEELSDEIFKRFDVFEGDDCKSWVVQNSEDDGEYVKVGNNGRAGFLRGIFVNGSHNLDHVDSGKPQHVQEIV